MRWNTKRRASAAAAAATLTAALVSLTSVEAQAVASTAKCANVVVIGARGTNDPQGMGLTGATATSVASRTSKTVRKMALVYDAAGGGEYYRSVTEGAASLRSAISSLVSGCTSSTRIVLIGHSQGAHVIGDVLDNRDIQLSSTAKSRIAAVVFYGDPAFRTGEAYNRGTGATTGRNGWFARPRGDLSTVATKIRSYCIADDWVCQSWPFSDARQAIHRSYSTKYSYSAATYILGKI